MYDDKCSLFHFVDIIDSNFTYRFFIPQISDFEVLKHNVTYTHTYTYTPRGAEKEDARRDENWFRSLSHRL